MNFVLSNVHKSFPIELLYSSKLLLNVKSLYLTLHFFFDNTYGGILENDIFKGNLIKKLDNTFIKLRRLWSIGDFSDKIYCNSILYRIYSDIVSEELFAYIPTSRKLQLESVIALISEKYSDTNFSIKELSEICNVSETHFRRLFTQVYHISPKKFITSYRLDMAKQMLKEFDCERRELTAEIKQKVETEIKYAGYIEKQAAQVKETARLESKVLPEDIDYDDIRGLRLEAIEKLKKVGPKSVGQASRISGVSPADISVLLIYLEKREQK